MIDRNKYESLADALQSVDDLDAVIRMVAREQAIREGMAETGEDRQTLTDFLDAHISMGEEAVLDLMDGEPTTLQAGLSRWLEELAERYPGGMHTDAVSAELGALLAYPWPVASPPREELALVSGFPEDDEHLVITLGGQEVATANHSEHGWSGMEVAQRTAEKVHAAILGKLAE